MFEANGYAIEQTGGGCTAWQKQSGSAYVWITSRDGGTHEPDADGVYIVGLYSITGASLINDDVAEVRGDAAAIAAADAMLAIAKWIPHHTPDQALRLAMAFGEKLGERLSRAEFRLMIDRNKAEDNPSVCHSHDFCDANVYMHEAFVDVVGRDPLDGEMTDADMALWNEAWNIAKAAGFFA